MADHEQAKDAPDDGRQALARKWMKRLRTLVWMGAGWMVIGIVTLLLGGPWGQVWAGMGFATLAIGLIYGYELKKELK